MAKIVIDGQTYEVNGENNLLQECLSKGLDLPYFCWHPCMGSVGACRQCAVKQYRDEDDEKGMLVMACMTPASDGVIISINDEQARKFRANVIESLMISHPHDCPVCEEGGECHLQDMTLMSGHNYRRYDKLKVTHTNQYLGPFIGHEMNRCITCYRCVRFYNDYAGGTDLSAQACHHYTYFGRHTDGCLESEFSGNLVEVCPTGVFTDATFSEQYTRKWDLQTAPSVCVGCAVGCNTTPGERYGTLRRIVNRYHRDINGYFLCDRGRFGYGFANSKDRLTGSMSGRGTERQSLSREAAWARLDELFAAGNGKVIGIGSPRAGNEANVALRQRVGADNFYAGCSDRELELIHAIIALSGEARLRTPSLREIEQADAVLIVGEDITNTAPRVALAVRQAVRNRSEELARAANIPLWQDAAVRELAQQELSPLYLLSGYATRLDDIARETEIAGVSALVGLTAEVARHIAGGAGNDADADPENGTDLVARIAADLVNARRPLIICGSGAGQPGLVSAAAEVALALAVKRGENPIDFCALVPEVNSIGHGITVPDDQSLGSALARMQSGDVHTAVVLENDLYRRAPSADVDAAIAGVKDLVAIDLLSSRTTDAANLVLASCSFAEQEASYVNYEGRAQLSMQVHIPENDCQPAWKWLSENRGLHFDGALLACEEALAGFVGLSTLLPDRGRLPGGMRIPRQPHRYSGRTAIRAAENVHEGKQPVDEDSVMSFSMEGVFALRDAPLMGNTWAPQWNSNQSVTKFQDEVAGNLLQGHPGVLLFSDKGSPHSKAADKGAEGNGRNSTVGDVPGRFEVFPAYHLYGSDELSARSEIVARRLTGSYLALSPADAEALSINHNDLVDVVAGQSTSAVAACIREKVKPGTVVLFTDAGTYPLAESGEFVQLVRREGGGSGRFENLIVSDLREWRAEP